MYKSFLGGNNMQFNFEKYDEGQWFQFFESEVLPDGSTIKYHDPKPDAGWFQIRQGTTEILDAIRQKTQGERQVNFVPNPNTRQMERVISYDQSPEQAKQEREMMWDYSIVSWRDIKDGKGEELPVTLENKMRLLNVLIFLRFLNRCLEIIGEQMEASQKN